MSDNLKFALAHIRIAQSDPTDITTAIGRYAAAHEYTIAEFVEHNNCYGDAYDFEWLSEIFTNDSRIRYLSPLLVGKPSTGTSRCWYAGGGKAGQAYQQQRWFVAALVAQCCW